MGSLFYLISVGLTASWIVAVFFGVGLFSLMPRSAKLAYGLSPGVTSFNASSAETPWLTQSTTRLDSPSSQPPAEPPERIGDAAKTNPHQMPAKATIAHAAEESSALTVELGTFSAATGEAAPMPAPRIQLFTAPEPRRASRSSRSPSSRKPLERRANTRKAQPHASVSAIQAVLQKHSRILK